MTVSGVMVTSISGAGDEMSFHSGTERSSRQSDTRTALYDPRRPILHQRSGSPEPSSGSRYNQRSRRSQILAAIRRLLAEEGLVGVTVRRIAEASGYAVQTIYSQVGCRDHAIIEAISEYTRYVGRSTGPRIDDPFAVLGITDGWLQSMQTTPEFCRQVSLMFFTQSRDVYYALRDEQLGRMCHLLARQQRCGALRAGINVRDLAEQLVLLSSALCIEWSDRPFPLEQLHSRLRSGFGSLLAGAIEPSIEL